MDLQGTYEGGIMEMDLRGYSLRELLLGAIKSEIESREIYTKLSGVVRNAFLKNRLVFLAAEEGKHREFLEGLFREMFNEGPAAIPERSLAPLPEIKVPGRYTTASEVVLAAMNAEKASSDFYGSLADLLKGEDAKKTVQYLSLMEMGHYRLLELEKEQLDKEEEYQFEWEMMHAGP